MRARTTIPVAVLASVVLLVAAAPASAGWHYNFERFIETSDAAGASGVTYAKRCARGIAGEWRFISKVEVQTSPSFAPKNQEFELEVRAKMPITTKFRALRDVDVQWRAKLPKDPELAALLTEHYERLAKSQADFYETMAVRWRPAKQQLDVEHAGLYYDEYEQLAPGAFTTHFKPKPGC